MEKKSNQITNQSHIIEITKSMLNNSTASELIISNIFGTLRNINENSGRIKILENTDVQSEFVKIFSEIGDVLESMFNKREAKIDINKFNMNYKMFSLDRNLRKLAMLALDKFNFDFSKIVVIYPTGVCDQNDNEFINTYIAPIVQKVN